MIKIVVSTPDITNNGVYILKIESDSNSIIMNGYTYSNGNGGGFGSVPGRHWWHIYNIKLKSILYPKYLLKSWYNYRGGLKIISFSEASIISLSFFAHDAPLIV